MKKLEFHISLNFLRIYQHFSQFSHKVLGTRTLLLSDPATILAGLTRRVPVVQCRRIAVIGKQTWYVMAVKRNVTTDKL